MINLKSQIELMENNSKYRAIKGSYGSGKSYTIIMAAVNDLLNNKNTVIISITPMLTDVIIEDVSDYLYKHKIPYKYRANYYENNSVIIRSLMVNNRSVYFVNSDDDLHKYLANIDCVYFDNLDVFDSEKYNFEWLDKYLNIANRFCFTYITETLFIRYMLDKYIKDDSKIIIQLLEDNPYLPKGYIEALKENKLI